MTTPSLKHSIKDRTETRKGAHYEIRIACTCGRIGAGKGFSKDRETAAVQARTTFDHHVRRAALTVEERNAENRGTALLVGIPATLVLAVIVAVSFGIANAIGGDEQGKQDDSTFDLEDSGSGVDCEKAVESTMESLYGSWGSGSWPDGEYQERLAQCENG